MHTKHTLERHCLWNNTYGTLKENCKLLCVKFGYWLAIILGESYIICPSCTYIYRFVNCICCSIGAYYQVRKKQSVFMSCSMADCVLNIVFLWYSKSLKGHGTRSSSVFRSWKTDITCCAVWRRSEPLFSHLSLFQPIIWTVLLITNITFAFICTAVAFFTFSFHLQSYSFQPWSLTTVPH